MSEAQTLTRLLVDLAAVLDRRGLAWYVFGAQAAVIWGRPRLTADVDVTVLVPDSALDALLGDLSRSGFVLRVSEVGEFVRRTRVLPLVHSGSHVPVDLVLAGPGLEEVFLQRARRVDLGGTAIPVISPEDLVVTKILAGRPKDIDDVQSVLRAQTGRLDLAWIREALRMLQDALGQSDLVPLLESELARIGT